MIGFNYNSFKESLKKVETEKHLQLKADIEQVKAFVEKSLTLFLESSSNVSRVNYQGLEM